MCLLSVANDFDCAQPDNYLMCLCMVVLYCCKTEIQGG